MIGGGGGVVEGEGLSRVRGLQIKKHSWDIRNENQKQTHTKKKSKKKKKNLTK